jgi:hypothetical protein
MKNLTGVWLDGSVAVVVQLQGKEQHVKEIHSDIENRVHHWSEGDQGTFMGMHHINQEKKFEERKKHQLDSYLKEVIELIKNDDEYYIFGPAEAKLRLKSMIEDNKQLSSRLRTVEAADHMTHNQIVAKVKDFYRE